MVAPYGVAVVAPCGEVVRVLSGVVVVDPCDVDVAVVDPEKS